MALTPGDGGAPTFCTDGSKDWSQVDTELRNAGYPGPFDHGSKEIAAYQSAAHCTPCVKGFNDTQCNQGGGTPVGRVDPVTWIKDHPIESALGALVLVLLLRSS